jgi:hypothetical protein
MMLGYVSSSMSDNRDGKRCSLLAFGVYMVALGSISIVA